MCIRTIGSQVPVLLSSDAKQRLLGGFCAPRILMSLSVLKKRNPKEKSMVSKIIVYHSKTKHIAIRHHFIRDAYEKKLIQVLKIHTDDNVADLLTKAFDVSSCDAEEMRCKFKIESERITNFLTMVLDLENTKSSQQSEIASLKRRRSRTHKVKRLYKVGLTARVKILLEIKKLLMKKLDD
ncbi:hypothetical protein Tco_0300606 [Tanacetum coccineum]